MTHLRDIMTESLESSDYSTESDGSKFAVLGLVALALSSSMMNWVVIRPLGKSTLTYSLWGLRGGHGLVVLAIVIAVVGAIVLAFKERVGLIILGIGVSIIGWLAALVIVLLGFIQQVVPAVDLLGVDLAKSQMGLGAGSIFAIISHSWLSLIIVTRLVGRGGEDRIRVLPLYGIIGLFTTGALTLLQHAPWVTLSGSEGKFAIEVSGDSIYGSSIFELIGWLGLGVWFGVILASNIIVIRVSAVVAILLGLLKLLQATLVYLFLSGIDRLLPDYIDSRSSKDFAPALPITAIIALASVSVGALILVKNGSGPSVRLERKIELRGRSIPAGTLCALFTLIALLAYFVVSAWRR